MGITSSSPVQGHRPKNDRGGALLAVLWLSAALGAIAFTLAGTVRGEVERTSTAVDGTRAYYLACGAIERTILHMLWSLNNPALAARYWVPGLPSKHLSFPGGEVDVAIIPEAAKLSVNFAPPEELFRLLIALGVDPGRAREIALAILDWRSPAAPGGGLSPFDQFYLGLQPSFRARHASFEEIEELLMVKGITPDLFHGTWEAVGQASESGPRLIPRTGLADCLSVFGTNAQVDANTAQPAVLAAVGLPPDSIAALVERRRVMPFLNPQQLAPFLQAAGPVGPRLRIGGSSIYTLRATARPRMANGQLGELRRSVAAMVKFMPPGYDAPWHILRWYDTAWSN